MHEQDASFSVPDQNGMRKLERGTPVGFNLDDTSHLLSSDANKKGCVSPSRNSRSVI